MMLGNFNMPPLPEVKAIDELVGLVRILSDPAKLAAQLEAIRSVQDVAQGTIDAARTAFAEAKAAQEQLAAERATFEQHRTTEQGKIDQMMADCDAREKDQNRRQAAAEELARQAEATKEATAAAALAYRVKLAALHQLETGAPL